MISNIHTHSIYCDGHDTPEAMVQTAISKGLIALGFSGHSYTPCYPPFVGMTPENITAYRAEVTRLKEVYADQIRIYLGLEQDMDSPPDPLDWEYRIGSIHFLKFGDTYHPIDESPALFQDMLDTCFDGQILALVENYCGRVLENYDAKKPDVIGHFDLYRKFNDKLHYLDETDPRYQTLAQDTLSTLIRKDALFEVNLGGWTHGYTHEPYPSVSLLTFLQKEKARVIITTDCHRAPNLDLHYDETIELLKRLGFPSMTVMGRNGFKEVPLS